MALPNDSVRLTPARDQFLNLLAQKDEAARLKDWALVSALETQIKVADKRRLLPGEDSTAHRLDIVFDDAEIVAAKATPAESCVNPLDALTSFGERRRFGRGQEIYGEHSRSTHWYQIISGTVRLTAVLADGRRHVSGFSFDGDCFGFDLDGTHTFAAEAVGAVVVNRHRHQPIEDLIGERPDLAQRLWVLSLRDLSDARAHNTLLGRPALVRVVGFLLDLAARRGAATLLQLPMPRVDIADYLGLSVESVCRILSRLSELHLIARPNVHQVELIDIHALETIFVEGFDSKLGCCYGSGRRLSSRQS